MLATFMEVLDTSMANVALPHIAGSMAASAAQLHVVEKITRCLRVANLPSSLSDPLWQAACSP